MSAHDPKDVARLREAFASRQDEGTGEPVDPERIFDALHANVTAEERQAVVEQLLTDAAAAEAWRLACDLRPDTTGEGALDHPAQEPIQPAAEHASRRRVRSSGQSKPARPAR